MLLPRLLRPLPADGALPSSVPPVQSPLSVISTRAGSFIGEVLARLISDAGHWDQCAWLREPPAEPAAFERAVADSLLLRQRVGRPDDRLGIDRAFQATGFGSVLVVELVGRCSFSLGRLLASLREHARRAGAGVVVAASGPVPKPLVRVAEPAMPLDTAAISRQAAETAGVAPDVVARVQKLLRGRDAVLHDLAMAGDDALVCVDDAAAGSHTGRTFLRKVTRLLLDTCAGDEREALQIAIRTGYWHPQFSAGSIETEVLRPWVVPLEHDWGWVRPVWRRALTEELLQPRSPDVVTRPATPLIRPLDQVWDPIVEMRLFGPFEMRLDGQVVGGLQGQLGTSVLRYILMRPGHVCPRDELIEAFWPEADPARARNRLQVALSSLRRAIREVADLDVVDYADGAYHINRNLDLTIDVAEFERLVGRAARAAKAGTVEAAMKADRQAVRIYRGDLCADLPYEEWTVFARERYRMMYVDVLDRLARNQWETGDLEGCIHTAQLMLEQDPCREDAHRLLMRCYAEQGRTHQALRQFDACRRILRASLATHPSRDTVSTYLEIRDRGG